jgi:hypothetical protein
MLLNWVALQLGLGIYFVNALCAAVLVVGLTKYCRQQPIPWLALAVAMPYLVAVVAMAYTRQAVALGLLFWGLSILRAGNERKFFSLIMFASFFHLSAIINLFYLVLTREKILRQYYLFFGLFIVGLLFLFVRLDVLQGYQSVFLYTLSIHSQGGVIRALMNVFPVIVSLFFWSRIKRISPDYKIIKWMAMAALLSLPLLSLSTTMVDRFALYLIPLQVALWPRLIAVQKTMLMRSIVASTILAYYGSVLFIWFNFAVNVHNWLPYQLWPFTNETWPPIF